MGMRMVNLCLRLVHDLPSAVQNLFRNTQVFKNLQIFRKGLSLPDTATNSSVDVGEVIEAVSHAIAVRGIFDDLHFAVNGINASCRSTEDPGLGNWRP